MGLTLGLALSVHVMVDHGDQLGRDPLSSPDWSGWMSLELSSWLSQAAILKLLPCALKDHFL